MANDSERRVKAFAEMTAAAKKTVKHKTIKKEVKKVFKKKDPKAFHDTMESKLDKLAKKHNVSIKLRRNKTKMSNVVIGKLKNKPYGEVVKLFNAISHTSPVPQKMIENGASFRLFGPRKKVTASNELTAADYHEVRKQITAKTKEKIEARKAGNIKKVDLLAKEIETLKDKLLTPEQKEFNKKLDEYDAHKQKIDQHDINSFKERNIKADDEDDTSDESDDDSGDDSDTDDSEEGDSAEDEANKASIVKFINDNNISMDALASVIDKAGKLYFDDMKTNAPVEDVVDFIYNVLGPDDVKTSLKALTNKQDVTASTSKVKARRN